MLSPQNAVVSFKELCGLTPAANMKQCILTVSTWLMNSERSLRVTVDLSETYPTMEGQGPVPELLRKVLNAYDMVNYTHRTEMFILQLCLNFFCFANMTKCYLMILDFAIQIQTHTVHTHI